jgi:hypothetical protein
MDHIATKVLLVSKMSHNFERNDSTCLSNIFKILNEESTNLKL